MLFIAALSNFVKSPGCQQFYFCAIQSFPSKYSCFCFVFLFFAVFFFSSYCQGVVIYVAITPTVSPVRLIPKNIKLFSLSAIGSIDVA